MDYRQLWTELAQAGLAGVLLQLLQQHAQSLCIPRWREGQDACRLMLHSKRKIEHYEEQHSPVVAALWTPQPGDSLPPVRTPPCCPPNTSCQAAAAAGPGNTIGFWTEYKTHPNQKDWMLALVRRHECWHPSRELDKWCSTDLFLTQVPTGLGFVNTGLDLRLDWACHKGHCASTHAGPSPLEQVCRLTWAVAYNVVMWNGMLGSWLAGRTPCAQARCLMLESEH